MAYAILATLMEEVLVMEARCQSLKVLVKTDSIKGTLGR